MTEALHSSKIARRRRRRRRVNSKLSFFNCPKFMTNAIGAAKTILAKRSIASDAHQAFEEHQFQIKLRSAYASPIGWFMIFGLL